MDYDHRNMMLEKLVDRIGQITLIIFVAASLGFMAGHYKGHKVGYEKGYRDGMERMADFAVEQVQRITDELKERMKK